VLALATFCPALSVLTVLGLFHLFVFPFLSRMFVMVCHKLWKTEDIILYFISSIKTCHFSPLRQVFLQSVNKLFCTFTSILTLLNLFWATVCNTVRPMPSVRCPVCLSVCLSVTLVYCGQTVGRIKTKLGMQKGLGPGRTVLDGDPASPPPRGHSPLQFLVHICCGQMAAWIKMPLGMELGLGQATLC